MASEPRYPYARKVMKTGTGTCVYTGFIMGYGVPSVPHIENISITTAAWTQYNIKFGTRFLMMKRRMATNAFRISTVATGATYLTINGGDSLTIHQMFGNNVPSSLYIQSVTDNDILEVLEFFDGQDCSF